MSTNRLEFAKLALDILLPLVEQRGSPISLSHSYMEGVELRINGLVVLRSQSIVSEWSKGERFLLLDIWPLGGKKVLSVRLPPLKVVSFKPGQWMEAVTALADRTATAAAAEATDSLLRRIRSKSARGADVEPRLDLRPAPEEVWHLVVPRRDVEAGDVSAVLSFLTSLSSDASSAWKMRDRVSVSFDGYSCEARSIFTVPEVRRFVARIHAVWPYWFFFLNQVDHSLKMVAACLCEMRRVEPASWKLSQADLMRFVGIGVSALGDLGKRYQFDEAEMDAIATGVFQYLHAELG